MTGDAHDVVRIGLAVTHEHPCLNTVMVQGMQQAVGGNRRSPRPLGRIDNQHSHISITKILKVTLM